MSASPTAWREPLLLGCTLAILVLVLFQSLVSINPVIEWDADPRAAGSAPAPGSAPGSAPGAAAEGAPRTHLTPPMLAWVNTVSVALAAAAMAAHVLAGGRVAVLPTALALLGMAACAYHMPRHIADLARGGTWIAAGALALAAYHLAQHARPRRWLLAGALALLVPLSLRSAWYVYVEHGQTVRMILEDQESILRARGWEPDSPQAKLYLRRLMFDDALGWYGLSNVFGSIVAAMTALAAGLVLGGLRAAREGSFATADASTTPDRETPSRPPPAAGSGGRGRSGVSFRRFLRVQLIVALILAAMGLFTLYLTRSRGAPAALVAGMGLLALAWAAAPRPTWRRWAGRLLAPAAMALIALAVLAVVARGLAGPPAPGERDPALSVFFRYQYWGAAVRAVEEEPAERLLLGTGVAGFHSAYLRHKDPLNPEEIHSTHNVFLDWIVMLGIGGWAWSALAVTWLWRAGRGAERAVVAPATAALEPSPSGGGQHEGSYVRSRQDPQSPHPVPLPKGEGEEEPRDIVLALAVAAAAMGAQRLLQWEMYDLLAAALWLVGLTGFVAAAALLASPRRIDERWLQVGAFAAAAVLLVHNQIEMTFFHPGAVAMAWLMIAAAAGGAAAADPAATESPDSEARKTTRLHPPSLALALALLLPAGWLLASYALPMTRHGRALSAAEAAVRRGSLAQADRALAAAAQAVPRDPAVVRWAVAFNLEEAFGRARVGDRAGARRALARALERLDEAEARGLADPMLARLRAQAEEATALLLADATRAERAVEAWRRVVQEQPQSLQDHMALADLLWRLGRHDEARAMYRQALRLSDQAYLDEAKQLNRRERALIAERMAEAR